MRDWQGIWFRPVSWFEVKLGPRVIVGLILLGMGFVVFWASGSLEEGKKLVVDSWRVLLEKCL